jgi:hypothetical protein
MTTAKTTVLLAILCLASACTSFLKEPVHPASQYDIKPHHGLVLSQVGSRWVSGKTRTWLETCDYIIDRKPGEPYVLFPDYIYTNCVQVGNVIQQ